MTEETLDLSIYRKILNLVIAPQLKQKRWSQSKLAKLAGIHRGTMSRYVSGEIFPTAETAERIADALGIPYMQFRSQIVMKTGKGRGAKLYAFGEEVEQFQKEVKKKIKGDLGGAIQTSFASSQIKNTPTDLIDQSEWEYGFSVVRQVTGKPSSIGSDDWSYFQEISNRVFSSERPARSISNRVRFELSEYLEGLRLMSADDMMEDFESSALSVINVYVFPPPVWRDVLVVETVV